MRPFSTRQYAAVFNQPLYFDISSVTYMHYMFYVRSARALPPPPQSGPPSVLLAPPPPHAPARMSPSSYASLSTAAECKRIVRRKQAPHPLCMGGQYRV